MQDSYNDIYENVAQIFDDRYESLIDPAGEVDELAYAAAIRIVDCQKASIGMIQREFKLGFNRAARIMDQLSDLGVVGPEMGIFPRSVLMSKSEIEELFQSLPVNQNHIEQVEEKPNKDQELFRFAITHGFSIDYSGNENRMPVIDNTLVVNARDDVCANTIINLVKDFPPSNVRFIYLGNDPARDYDLPHYIVKCDNIYKHVYSSLCWAWNEVESRKQKFVDSHVRRIEEFNSLVSLKDRLPIIVVIVEEIAEHITPEILEALLHILLAGPQFGVVTILASKLSQRGLRLGSCIDMLKVVDSRSFVWGRQINSQEVAYESNTNFDAMTGLEFEHYCANVLMKNGFEDVETTQGSGDYGGDIIAYKDDIKYTIQCKLYSEPVGISAVQEVIGSKSIYECHVGAVLTNNKFTPAAIELAKRNLILLWDGDKLQQMIANGNQSIE